MWRRVYFMFPAPEQARRAVAELEENGIGRDRMHVLAREGVDIRGLPQATDAQKRDRVWFWDRLFWMGGMALFGLLALGFLYFMIAGSVLGAQISLVLAVMVFLLEARFAIVIPHAHLSEMKTPLLHGEVVLMVDAPLDRVGESIALVTRRHPEAGIGGVGWTLKSAGI
ncbi:MAG: hypothetical protein A2514_07415 [Gammaproteobacteria bacterium RIFOXYD12_FULL_61_37]|nr:MAG: hypothetical protein A2514_07415 [Gammaproteobacteria bacterium RIFOXYD12_FULL_61_37]